MKMYQLFFVFLLSLISFTLTGQRHISGRITDADDGAPIPGAAVFIANTTAGTATDAEGNYRLKISGEGSYRLAVSHVGYQPVFMNIESEDLLEILDISMQLREMEEVTVTAKTQFRKTDVELFWKTILGKKPSPKTIHATNPEDIYFYYNSETRKLTVTCRVPLQIVNNETGYHIQFILDRFTYDYNTGVCSWNGEYMFRELEPENYRQKNNWEKNRKKIYRVSVPYFMKSLYHDSLMKNGFLLVRTGNPDTEGPFRKVSLIPTRDFLINDSANNGKNLHVPSDSSILLVCFGKPVIDKDIVNIRLAQNGRKKWSSVGLFRNMLQTPGDTVRIFPDGTFWNTLNLTPVFSSKSLSGLDMMLPVEYNPKAESDEAARNEEVPPATVPPVNPLADTLIHAARRFNMQLSVFPQEKVYLHTDKPYYISGERIWFRTHVVDAALHIPASLANSVYVELFDLRDSVINRVKIGLENNTFSGYINIPENIPEGDYTIRAYTGRMRNLNEDYFFMKNIRIGDPMSRTIQAILEFEFTLDKKIGADIRFSSIHPLAPITPESVNISINNGKLMNVKCESGLAGLNFNLPPAQKQRILLLDAMYDKRPFRQYIRIPLPDDDFDVSFYPEGGSALYGCMGRIAFKAMQQDGTEIDVAGVVYDRQGNEIIQFKTDVRGMGQFMIAPEQDETYYAVCTNSKGQSKRFELPVARGDGYALSTTWLKDQLMVEVRRPEAGKTGDTLCLIVHTRGVVQDVRILYHTNEPVVFRKDLFPSGVTSLLLLTKNMVPVSERLVFAINEDQANVRCRTDKDTYIARSPVEYTVNITDESGEPLRGNLSVSITDDHEVTVDTTSNILTSILLTSDIRGNIPDPAYFFQKNAKSAYGLELLMLTHGWRRYDTERIVRNDFMYPDTLFEKGYEISGTVNRQLLTGTRTEENANVNILSFNGEFFGNTITDHIGRFYLPDGELRDSTWFMVQATPQSGRSELELILDKASYPERVIPLVTRGVPERNVFANYADKAERQYVDEHGTRIIHISEVTITAERKPVERSIYGTPDHSITEEELDKNPPSSLTTLFSRLPGVKVAEADGIVTFKLSRYPEGEPLILIDGTPTMMPGIDIPPVDDIAQVDILTSSTNLSVFRGEGLSGAIAIYTKAGKIYPPREKPYIKQIMPLGFQKPAEFYAPKYDTPVQNIKPDLRTTIHWQPSLTTDEMGKASFRFYTADAPSTYTVVIEGVTDDGKVVYQRDKVKVGEK